MVPAEYPGWIPTVDDVATVLSTRTHAQFRTIGTFTADTTPTADQVQDIIYTAADLVVPKVGDVDGRAARLAATAVKYKAAQVIEVTFFPQEANPQNSPAASYAALFTEALDGAVQAAADPDEGGSDNGDEGGADTEPVGSGGDVFVTVVDFDDPLPAAMLLEPRDFGRVLW